jgi:hypothetical protein
MLRGTPRGPQIRAVEPGLLYCAFRRKDESMLVCMLKSRIPHKFLLGALSRRTEDLPIIQPFPLHLSSAISRAIIDGSINLFTIIDLERLTKDMRRIGVEPVAQNYTLQCFRSAAGDAIAGLFLLDSVLYACGSLREAIESYEKLIQVCRDYSYAGSNSKQSSWSSVEPFLQIGIDMPGELKRMIAKNITATGAPPLFRVGMSKRRTSD